MVKRIFFFIIIFFCSGLLFGQTKTELELKKKKAREEIDLTTELLQKTTKKKESSLQQINLLSNNIQERKNMISSIESEIRLVDYSIDLKNTEITELQRQIEKEKKEYTQLIYSAYVSQSAEDRFMYILASKDIGQAYQRIKYLKYLTEYRKNRIKEIESSIDELDKKKTELQKIKSNKEILINENVTENRKLANQLKEKDYLVTSLKSQEFNLRQELKRKEKIKAQIEAEINKIIEEEARKVKTSNLYNSLTPEQKLISNEFKANKGRLPWPVDRGIISGHYGKIKHPVLNDVWISNNGIDITSISGTKARALFDGEVSRVIAILGANYSVIIRHGEFLTVYQNLINVRVKAGDKIRTKQVLGDIYIEDGSGSGVLHLEIWKERDILNPEEWIAK